MSDDLTQSFNGGGHSTNPMLERILEEMIATRDEVRELRVSVARLEADVAEVKADVAGLKADVAEGKADVAGLKTDAADLKVELRATNDRIGRIESGIDEVRSEIMLTRSAFRGAIDLETTTIHARLGDLERRIRSLEDKQSV